MKTESALSTQVGGSHYKDCAIQPIQYIEANNLAFLEACVVKRVTRHGKPTGKGRQDIEKAIHELQLLLEIRYAPVKPEAWEASGPYTEAKAGLIRSGACKAATVGDLCGSCTTSCKAFMETQADDDSVRHG